ncbi:hypothetical protein FHETE_656 [Fusarium heterosporum]|uniref:Uncharacterized protein n=1 Tax=Fusarium heterosporum TaxID=42747 RepID=A0A8H5TWR1_FUSHE|nr:hypothetical protein FHETE_656 [Fusarium heterosporum]
MKELLNKLLYGSSGPQGAPTNDGTQVFAVWPHSKDNNILSIVPAGTSKEAPPLYTIHKRPSSSSFTLHHGYPAPNNIMGTATMHLSTSTVDLSVYNQPMVIKNSSMTGSWSIQTNMGKFKWKVNQLTGTGFELYDQIGNKVAKYGSAGLARFGEKQMNIYIPGDEFFTIMVLLSAVASKELAKIISEVVGEVAGAVAGV